jgi:peptidoglycan/xylan/chitin deacetylase (PgdA/CDA1 family)
MLNAGAVYLMYHELGMQGRPPCQDEPGYLRYVVDQNEFRRQLADLAAHGFRGLSVTQALTETNGTGRSVAITFDDGCETDLLAAAPMLSEMGFGATFYVVAGFLGRRGYLSEDQVRELSSLGFEIGSHSVTHPYLPSLAPRELRTEVLESKDRLEQIIGAPVDHFSCPGGRWTPLVSEIARAGGYRSVATSRIGVNSHRSDPFRLARVAVRRETDVATFSRLCRSEGLLAERARNSVLAAAKGLLGDRLYERVRAGVLHRGSR